MITRNLILPALIAATVGLGVLATPDTAHATNPGPSKAKKQHPKPWKYHAEKKKHKKHEAPPPPTAVPELNGSGLAASMFFLAGGALLLTGRRRVSVA